MDKSMARPNQAATAAGLAPTRSRAASAMARAAWGRGARGSISAWPPSGAIARVGAPMSNKSSVMPELPGGQRGVEGAGEAQGGRQTAAKPGGAQPQPELDAGDAERGDDHRPAARWRRARLGFAVAGGGHGR